ncbi:MAG: Bug family tripartite tricarboxylate transporter substrate binding protein [Xanthobacteraceae bacterium]
MFRLCNLILQVFLSAGWLVSVTHPSVAQDTQYPSRPVRIIVPFAAGGPTDIAARIVADKLSKAWGQSVVVESRPGGGSMIGAAAVANSSPDGYTMLFGPSSALIEAVLMSKDAPFDPIKSFAPVTEVYKLSAGLSINKKVPAANLKELIALSRSKPLTYSSFGVGTGPHLLLETFKSAAGIDAVHVPYKGNVPGLAAVVSGEVDMTGAGLGTIRPHLKSGALKLLAVDAEQESKHAPGVPTFKALGYPDVSGGTKFMAVWMPAGTPPAIVEKANAGIRAALDSAEFKAFLDKFAYDKATATTPQALADLVRTSLEHWRPVINSLKIGARQQ